MSPCAIPWDDYEALLDSRGDDAAVNIRFHAHTQDLCLMAPLPRHGRWTDILVDWVKVLLRHQL